MPDKYLEAPHLKAEGAVVHVAGGDVRRVEIQEHAVDTANRRRVAVPVAADVRQLAAGVDAVARGPQPKRAAIECIPAGASGRYGK